MNKKSYKAIKADTVIPQGLSSGNPRYDNAAEKFRMDALVLINDLRVVENAIPKNLRQSFEKISDMVQRDILDAAHRVDGFGSRIYQNLMG
jgi:hypothetical protein